MLSAETIKTYAESISIPAVGICDAEPDETLRMHLTKRRAAFLPCAFEEEDIEKRTNPKLLLPSAKSVLVCLFPYFCEGDKPENLSRYAAVRDYHKVVSDYLAKIAAFVKKEEPAAECLPLCDTSPLVDRWLAYKAGLGFFGKNNMLIHPDFGSWFFIGSLLLSLPLTTDRPMAETCGTCGACIKACPGGALSDDFGFDAARCISYLTQKKELTEAERELLKKQDSVYGCDACQRVCPYNRQVGAPMPEFCDGGILRLDKESLKSLSGREFKRRYEDYAFSWCTKQTILKNFG